MNTPPLIEGKSVWLRAPAAPDLPSLLEMRNDLETQKLLLALPRPSSEASIQDWLARRHSDPTSLLFIIATAAKSEPAGFIQLTNIDLLHRHAELGICLRRSFRGHGYGREALHLLEEFSRKTFALRKILLRTLTANTSAIEFYARSRYRTVGVLQNHFFQDGHYQDVTLMEHLLPAEQA